MRNPGEITNGHKDLRATERIIISTKWWTDRLVEWLSEWILWNEGSLKLKVSGFLTIRASTDKRRERAAYSTTGPLTFCGFIKRNYNHISGFLSARLMCPWATRSSPLCLWVHLLKMKAKLLKLAKPFYFTLRSGPKHLQYPLSEMTFLWHVANENSKLVLSVERQNAGFTLGSLLNHTLKIALMHRQFTQWCEWHNMYCALSPYPCHCHCELESSSLSCPCPAIFPVSNCSIFSSAATKKKKNLEKEANLSGPSLQREKTLAELLTQPQKGLQPHICHQSQMTHRSLGPVTCWGPVSVPVTDQMNTHVHSFTQWHKQNAKYTLATLNTDTLSLSLLFQSPVDGTRSFNILSCQYQLFLTE